LKSCLRKSHLENGNVKTDHLLSRPGKKKTPSLGWKSNTAEKNEGDKDKKG